MSNEVIFFRIYYYYYFAWTSSYVRRVPFHLWDLGMWWVWVAGMALKLSLVASDFEFLLLLA